MWYERTELLLGADNLQRLDQACVAVIGIGGVGGYAAEMLVRAGLGHIVLVDSDTVSETNLNRQLLALRSTIGRKKCDVLRERLLDIHPDLDVRVIADYIHEDNVAALLDPVGADLVIDAIDTLSPKIALIQYCLGRGLKLVSSMGAGAKLDATAVRIDDISHTRECPLAHALRKRLHRLGVQRGFLAVYSVEKPRRESVILEESRNKKSQVGTVSYLPAVFGCACAQAALAELLDIP